MSGNACIPAVARLLNSNEPLSALATILFDHYSALPSNAERSAFVIALIGELLVARARHETTSAAFAAVLSPTRRPREVKSAAPLRI